jgi:hypothetical protein
MIVLRDLSEYKLDLVGVQEVRWEGGGTEPAGEYTFFYGKGNGNHELGSFFFVHKRIISAVKGVEFVSDRMSYNFKAKIGREDIFKPTTGNESLHEISNDNGVRLVNFATSKNLSQKYDVPTSQHP